MISGQSDRRNRPPFLDRAQPKPIGGSKIVVISKHPLFPFLRVPRCRGVRFSVSQEGESTSRTAMKKIGILLKVNFALIFLAVWPEVLAVERSDRR
jgi:hypothetical protein